MKKCESWAVAAVCLIQSQNDSEHYTNIAKYVLETGLTALDEKGGVAAQSLAEILRQKVENGQAIFNTEGNGCYSLNDEDATRKHKDVLYVLQCLKSKKPKIDNLIADEENKQKRDESRKLRDENKKLCDENERLCDENKKLQDENEKLQEENQQLEEKLQSIKRLCE